MNLFLLIPAGIFGLATLALAYYAFRCGPISKSDDTLSWTGMGLGLIGVPGLTWLAQPESASPLVPLTVLVALAGLAALTGYIGHRRCKREQAEILARSA